MKTCPCCGNATTAETINEYVALAIKGRRKDIGMSQTELGKRLSPPVGHPSIVAIEQGKTELGLDRISQIAAILGVHWRDLLPEEGDER